MVSSQQPRQRRSTAAFGSGSTSQLSTITVLRSVLFTKQLNAYTMQMDTIPTAED